MGETTSRIGENTSKINETVKATIKKTQDIATVFVDTKTDKHLHDMGAQTNPQLKLELVDLPFRRYKMNGVNITQEQGAFLVRIMYMSFPKDLLTFLLNQKVFKGY